MLYDVDFTWLIAIGILIGLSIILTFLTEDKFDISTIIIYMSIINAFLVSTEILPLWTEVMFLLLLVGLGVLELKSNNGG